jgi:hypothetical protein
MVQKQWPALQRHHVFRGEMLRISLLEIRMRAAIMAVQQGAPSQPLIASAERDATSLQKERARYALAHAYSGHACIAQFRGDRTGAVRRLERAIEIFDEVELTPYAEAARRALGILLQGESGGLLVRQADDSLRAHGYCNLSRHMAVYVPILTVSQVAG